MSKTRLDQWLVAHKLCESRTLAQRFIQAGQVFVNGQLVDKPATKIPDEAQVKVKALPRYVSRGGEKLEAALGQFGINAVGKICLDVGASTGGFSDCLLQHGAAKVYAVDVGKHQLHPKLRADTRVKVMESLNARTLSYKHVPEPIMLATVDVSFISLEKVLPAMQPLLAPNADLIALVKPQFEAGRQQVGRGGVVKDPNVHLQVLQSVVAYADAALTLGAVSSTFSPLRGPAGNIEFLVHFHQAEKPLSDEALEAVVISAHRTFSSS